MMMRGRGRRGTRPGFDVSRRGQGLGDTAALGACNGGAADSGRRMADGGLWGAGDVFDARNLRTAGRNGVGGRQSVNKRGASGRTVVVLGGMTSGRGSGRTRQAAGVGIRAMG
jgi:hypothetical protein